MNKLFQYSSLTLTVMMFSGCASIMKDDYQRMQIETYSKSNALVSNAKCRAKNDRGEWVVFTAGTFIARRSDQNLLISCEKEGEATGYATLISRANEGMYGNIFLGGEFGAMLDHHNGNAYSYPDWIRVIMGDNLVFDRKNNERGQLMLGSPSGSVVQNDKKTLVDKALDYLP
ncbi:hypothetical protein [Methylotenera sp. L2L1]|uniref:hypothetical protein n=1 Tax=Methylotenera sp. L2L1 TaxID=1502770 RepID=UPI00055F5E56|nr:hypothetical protein [Methylotenera sp. L2L1]